MCPGLHASRLHSLKGRGGGEGVRTKGPGRPRALRSWPASLKLLPGHQTLHDQESPSVKCGPEACPLLGCPLLLIRGNWKTMASKPGCRRSVLVTSVTSRTFWEERKVRL